MASALYSKPEVLEQFNFSKLFAENPKVLPVSSPLRSTGCSRAVGELTKERSPPGASLRCRLRSAGL